MYLYHHDIFGVYNSLSFVLILFLDSMTALNNLALIKKQSGNPEAAVTLVSQKQGIN